MTKRQKQIKIGECIVHCQANPGIYHFLPFLIEEFEVEKLQLSQLIEPLVLKQTTGNLDVDIRGLTMDSRQVKPGDLFIAKAGFTVDGHDYIDQAIEKGASALLVEKEVATQIPTVRVPDSQRAMAILAAHYYQYPTKELKVIGVTGTNGKTTTTHLIQQMFDDLDHPTGIIGTIGIQTKHHTYPSKNTTPEVLDLQKGFSQMRKEGLKYAAMEVSSHALDLGRTRGIEFHIAVFTNLTQDHLDYHETMEKYREAKGLLFSQLGNDYQTPSGQMAVLNADDPASSYFARITPAQIVTYGIKNSADVRAKKIQITSQGTVFQLHTFQGSIEVHLPLVGMFNVYNALAAAAVALIEGFSLHKIKNSLERVKGVAGRFECVNREVPYMVLVDYSHTPDSLENALSTIQEFAEGKVICVVGCGGDRDRSKRPQMAKVAESYSDLTIVTSDNPRSEPPEQILDEMVQGFTKQEYVRLVDRQRAIEFAIEQAGPGDVVLIAGKGHETYQEIQGVRYDFDDREVARMAIQNREKGSN